MRATRRSHGIFIGSDFECKFDTSMYIQNESDRTIFIILYVCRGFCKSPQSTTRCKRIRSNARHRLRRNLCPSDKDDHRMDRNCSCNNKTVAPPPDGRQERLSSRRIRRGGVTYMIQPPGFESRVHPNVVCRLKKPLYGLKQAPHVWHSKITRYLHQIGFRM